MDELDIITVVNIWFAGVFSVLFLYFSTILIASTLQLLKIQYHFSTGFKLWRFYITMLLIAFFRGFFRVLLYWPVDFWRVQEQIPKLYERTKVSFSISALPLSKKGKKDVALYFHQLGVDQGQMQAILFKFLENSIAKTNTKKNRAVKLDDLLDGKEDQVHIQPMADQAHTQNIDMNKIKPSNHSKEKELKDLPVNNWQDFDQRRIAMQKALQQEMQKRGMEVPIEASPIEASKIIEKKIDAAQSLDQKKASSLYEKNKK
jgi:hypothetical protein